MCSHKTVALDFCLFVRRYTICTAQLYTIRIEIGQSKSLQNAGPFCARCTVGLYDMYSVDPRNGERLLYDMHSTTLYETYSLAQAVGDYFVEVAVAFALHRAAFF